MSTFSVDNLPNHKNSQETAIDILEEETTYWSNHKEKTVHGCCLSHLKKPKARYPKNFLS